MSRSRVCLRSAFDVDDPIFRDSEGGIELLHFQDEE